MTVTLIDDFIPADLLESCAKTFQSVGWKYGWTSDPKINYTHWHHDILNTNASNRINREDRLLNHQRQDYKPVIEIWKLMREKLFPYGPDLLRCYANQHTFGVEGYAHRDSDDPGDITIIIYLNREWKINWGGETAFYDNGEIVKAVMPKFGRIVTFPSNMLHAARNVTRVCPRGRKTLMYKIKVNDSATTS